MKNPSDRVCQPERRPFWEQPERLTYEAAIIARNPRLASLLAPLVDDKGGAR